MVPTAGGLYIVLTVLVVEAGRAVLGALGIGDHAGLTLPRSEMLLRGVRRSASSDSSTTSPQSDRTEAFADTWAHCARGG